MEEDGLPPGKLQVQPAAPPVERSVKLTLSGGHPERGVPEKFAVSWAEDCNAILLPIATRMASAKKRLILFVYRRFNSNGLR